MNYLICTKQKQEQADPFLGGQQTDVVQNDISDDRARGKVDSIEATQKTEQGIKSLHFDLIS
jgi:hypothetical protein